MTVSRCIRILLREITLQDRDRIEALRKQYKVVTAGHSFAQLYLWRNVLKLQLHLEEELYSTHGALYGGNAWLFPVGEEQAKIDFLRSLLEKPNLLLTNVRQEDKAFLEQHFPGRFIITPAPDESEYLYDRAEQLSLQGKRFAGIRNHIRRAEKDNELSVELLTEENIDLAIEIAEDWGRLERASGEHGIRDDGVPTEMLRLKQELSLHGILVRVGGEGYAVCAGYPLSDTVFDFALSKLRSNLPGLSYYAKWALYESLPEHFLTINAEDDVGIEGLRTMKYQMRPSGMIELYHAAAAE